MPILSYLHQLFDVPTCYAYIHRLRWKDRPLQCPRCQSHDVGSWGDYHYRSGCQRYRCRDCERTFNDLTGTLMHQSKRSLPHWILATFLLCLTCSSRRIAREVGVHIRTSYRWCWWLRNAALSYEMERQLEGTIEADDLYHTAGHKGQAKGGARSRWAAERVAGARSASPAAATTTKIGPPSLPGSAARVVSWCTQHGTLPSRRCRRPLTSPCKRAVAFIRGVTIIRTKTYAKV
jgi:transposase-like protein